MHLIVEKPDRLTRNFTNREQIQFLVMMGKLVIHYYKDHRVMAKWESEAEGNQGKHEVFIPQSWIEVVIIIITIVRMGVGFIGKKALHKAELNWKMATSADRVLLIKNVLSNFSLDGSTLRYDLKRPFQILAQIKNNGGCLKWWLFRESNSDSRK